MIAAILVGIFSFLYALTPLVAMTANVNTQTNGQSIQPSHSSPTTNGTAQAPSVPISLYREVASELQTTRTTLQSLKTQNQELLQKNQQLRLEIERVVQSALHLRQVADSSWGLPDFPESTPDSRSSQSISIAPQPGTPLSQGADSPQTEASSTKLPKEATPLHAPAEHPHKLRSEQSVQPLQRQSEPATEISTWWLILLVCFIVVTAFGTGFLLVRPLLPSR